jgi:DNA-binding LacI/PurR family transcriptional regulator
LGACKAPEKHVFIIGCRIILKRAAFLPPFFIYLEITLCRAILIVRTHERGVMRQVNSHQKEKGKRIKGKFSKNAVKTSSAGLVLAGNEIMIISETKPHIKKTKTIAFISGRIGSAFVSSVIRGAEERVRGFGAGAYELHHYPSAGRKNGPGDAVREIMAGEKADGIIILSVMPDDKALKLMEKSPLPVVFIERQVKGAHSVTIDNYAGGYAAAMRLINSKRKKTGIIFDPQCREKGMASCERVRGFMDAMKKSGLTPDRCNFTGVEFHNIEQGRKAFDRIAKRINKIDSIFSAAGDLAAIGFMLEARAVGVKVPSDLAIIGFDDVEMASAVEPLLTTVRQPVQRMGAVAMEIMHEHFIHGIKNTKNIVLESELIVRDSA